MLYSKPLRCRLSRIFHQLWYKVSGIPVTTANHHEKETPGEIISQRHEITCKCGWHGRGSDSIREYCVLSEQVVELRLFCKECKGYLGFMLYKDAA